LKRRSAITPVGHCDTTSRGHQKHDLPGRCSNTRSAERRYQVVRAIRPRRSPIGVRWATRRGFLGAGLIGPARPNSLGARSARVPTISLMDRLLGLAAAIGEDPSDSGEMRLRKALLVVLGHLISLLAVG